MEPANANPVAATRASLESAWRLADRGALDEALRICDTLLAEARTPPAYYYLRGVISAALNRFEAAEEFFSKTLYLDPEHYPALLHMSTLCDLRGEPSRGELFRTRARRIAGRGTDLQ